MRTLLPGSMAIGILVMSCASTPDAGSLGDESSLRPSITSVDSARPPRFAWVQPDQPAYVALLLVAPGHSATLLYPPDSMMDNRLSAGAHRLTFEIPAGLLPPDSLRGPVRPQDDTARGGIRVRRRGAAPGSMPLPEMTPVYLLLATSPQPLSYQRIREKTVGVSIPTVPTEALNAVGKAIKSTLSAEPREWAGYYQRIELARDR